ncbi:substrate-binding domain-containing protein [Gordonia pseudamarae]|jgi:ribose transport system substrate-binding protein|uniref:Substrate-binding domain-containing protein n=1 Tax=Gordonia pseudamarae TaxID=2831662 RepID=A0ABX6IDF1_9ACTN|nr:MULTISPECIES: sugar ABC transporter substrate-binding protein [Gordonia]MBD0022130.1 sugar ABC transporter substrate-binding protein [Gordonia sp. (in: high G+C Gram-positive bacteria)]QHN24978.1 substrate-binding domain-containing protein [Gordonia pseudamarae]QHN33912.1 substrate-binding domain-containing protein [Gordonia pseudamarae]
MLTRRTLVRRLAAATTLATVSVLGLTACGSVDESGSNEKTIAISFPNFSRTPALQVEIKAAQDEADKQGYKLILDDPGSDLDKQVSTIRTWIPQKYGAILAVALDATVLEGVAGEVVKNGTQWITYGSTLKTQTGEIDMQQRAAGEQLAQLAGDWFNRELEGKGEVAVLTYEEAEWSRERQAALEEKLAQVAPGVKVVARQDALSETEGLNATKSLLQANPGLNAVLAVSESASVGAYSALSDKRNPNMFIGGMDGNKEALDAIGFGGAYRGSAALDLNELGRGMITTAINSITGDGESVYRVSYVPVIPGSRELSQMQALWK